LKEGAVVAGAEAKAGTRFLEPFHVAVAAGQIAVYAMQNLQGSLAINAAKVGACFWRPDHCNALRIGIFDLLNYVEEA
jgi:hypothetical protein